MPPPSLSRGNISITRETIEKHTRHVFEGRFTPLRLIVNGRKGRRVIVVLGSDKKHYRVLDMDFMMKKSKEGRDEDSESESESEADRDSDVEMGGA
jgi:anaphase-promoting complex subunit 4